LFEKLLQYANRPVLFAKGTANFWDDPHISEHLLAAHLNPTWDAASRRPETIDKTVAWINSEFLPAQAKILDLGCGPGLYAERLASLGHEVTGVDFSKRSIDYATKSAQEKGLGIGYHYQNYLEINYSEQFDLVMLIYCDFGALTDIERGLLLQKIYMALKPGGIVIFDVFTEDFSTGVKEGQSWEVTESGFWAKGLHCTLEQTFHYVEAKVQLSQTIVMRDNGTYDVYRIYDSYFSEDDLYQLLTTCGFLEHNFYYNMVSETNFESQKFRFVVAKK